MQLFGNRYFDLRNNNVFPLIDYGVPVKELKDWDFRTTILNNISDIDYIQNSDFTIEISKTIYYKALLSDVELFLNRSIIQYCDFYNSLKRTTDLWTFISFYYHSFFTAITLLKLNGVSLTYLNKELIKIPNEFYLLVRRNVIKLREGDYSVTVDHNFISPSNVKLIFREKSKGGIHKHCWIAIDQFLRSLKIGAVSDEKTVIQNCIELLDFLSPNFPSELRNNLNYKSFYGEISEMRKIKFPEIQYDSNKLLKNYFSAKRSKDVNDIIFSVYNFNLYLFSLLKKLHSEYLLRSPNGRSCQKSRSEFLNRRGIIIPCFDNE